MMVINCYDWSLMVRSKVNSSSWFEGFDTLYNSHNIWMNYNETTSRHHWNDALGKAFVSTGGSKLPQISLVFFASLRVRRE